LDFGIGAEHLDKRTFSDVKNGFLTLPLILFFEESSPKDRQEMLSLLENAQRPANQAAIREFLEDRAVFQKAREMAVDRVASGLPFLESLPETPAVRHLLQLCLLMTERTL